MKLFFYFFIFLFLVVFNIKITTHAAQPKNIANTIFSILSYVNLETKSPLICTINNPSLSGQLVKNKLPQSKYQLKNINTTDIKKSNCNVIIFSTVSPKEEQSILNSYVNFPTLSISTNNISCEEGSAICLYQNKDQISFKINLESVNQSKIAIDPRVLLLAKESE